jgi:hypothetical protein
MQAASVADEVLIQLGENVQMCIGTRAKPNVRVNLKGYAKYVYDRQLSMSYLYKGATAYPPIPTSTSIKRKPYARICCILDYLNACVLQKRAWPNSINSSKYTKLPYY